MAKRQTLLGTLGPGVSCNLVGRATGHPAAACQLRALLSAERGAMSPFVSTRTIYPLVQLLCISPSKTTARQLQGLSASVTEAFQLLPSDVFLGTKWNRHSTQGLSFKDPVEEILF